MLALVIVRRLKRKTVVIECAYIASHAVVPLLHFLRRQPFWAYIICSCFFLQLHTQKGQNKECETDICLRACDVIRNDHPEDHSRQNFDRKKT